MLDQSDHFDKKNLTILVTTNPRILLKYIISFHYPFPRKPKYEELILFHSHDNGRDADHVLPDVHQVTRHHLRAHTYAHGGRHVDVQAEVYCQHQ